MTQVFAFWLVERLNTDLRRLATPEDVEATRREVPGKVGSFFGDELLACEQRSPETRAALMAMAQEQAPTCDGPTRRWLRLRGMMTDTNTLRVPLFRDYLLRRLAEEA